MEPLVTIVNIVSLIIGTGGGRELQLKLQILVFVSSQHKNTHMNRVSQKPKKNIVKSNIFNGRWAILDILC